MSAQTVDRDASELTTGAATAMPPRRGPVSGPSEGELAPGVPLGANAEAVAPAAPSSALRSLRELIADAEREEPLHLDLQVPRMRGVGLRLRPIGSVEYGVLERRIMAKGSRVPADRRMLMLNATVLAVACLGVHVLDEDGNPTGEPEQWVRPGPALARELGKSEAELPTAAETLLALFRTEGDLMSAALQLVRWSGSDSAERDPLDLGD